MKVLTSSWCSSIQKFLENFSAFEFVEAAVADINQQAADAERFVLPDTLFKWLAAPNLAVLPEPSLSIA